MQIGSNSLQNKFCFCGEQFSEKGKINLRVEVCKDLPIEFETDGKYYCVLHSPDNLKQKDTNFDEVLRQRVDNQENNFCGVYFSGEVNFKNHTFKSIVNFERTFFEKVNFDNVIFEQGASFEYASLKKSKFQNADFRQIVFFLGTSFADNAALISGEPFIHFTNTKFFNSVFQNAIFHKDAHFKDSTFEKGDFSRAEFKKGAYFFSTNFTRNAWFSKTIFSETTEFNNCIFDCDEQGFPIKIENKVVKSYFKVTKLKKVNEYATLSRR